MNVSERVFRVLVRAYPKRFRAEFEAEMIRLFREQLRDARRQGRMGVAMLWVELSADLVVTAPAEHLRERAAQARTTEGNAMIIRSTAGFTKPQRVALVLAAAPVVVSAGMSILAPGAMEPAFANPPAVIGLPLGSVLLAVAIAWSLLAYPIVRATRSTAGVVVTLLVFTFPATLASDHALLGARSAERERVASLTLRA
jgi:hypothetical protein